MSKEEDSSAPTEPPKSPPESHQRQISSATFSHMEANRFLWKGQQTGQKGHAFPDAAATR